jgi:hypothetical protein
MFELLANCRKVELMPRSITLLIFLLAMGRALHAIAADEPPKPDLKALGEKLKAAVEDGDLTRDQAREAHRLMSFYVVLDLNGNGALEPAEYEQNRYRDTIERRIRDAGGDPRKPVSLDKFLVNRLGSAGIESGKIRRVVTFVARPPAVRQRITVDLPERYLLLDADKDNQLGLDEWPKDQLDEFYKLDLNDDGFATAREIHIVETLQEKMAN